MNETQQSHVWYATLLFSAAVFLVNMLFLSIGDAVAGDRGQVVTLLLVLAAILVLWLLMQFLFHAIVTGIMAKLRAEERSRILETQESQFAAQQRYMKAMEKERHDFRHSSAPWRSCTTTGTMRPWAATSISSSRPCRSTRSRTTAPTPP